MKPLKIAMISDHASPLAALGSADAGGQNVYVAQLSRHLANLGHKVDIFTRRDREDLAPVQCVAPGIRVIFVPAGPAEPIAKERLMPFMDEFAEFTAQWARTRRYDLVHANFWMSGMVALRLKRELGIPFVVTFHALGRVRRLHQGVADGFPASRASIEDQIIAASDRVIAECPQDEDDLRRYYQAPPERISIIPCGVDTEELQPVNRSEARQALGLTEDERVILSLGRIVQRKGTDTVLHAIALLRNAHHIGAHLLIVGGDSGPIPSDEILRLQGTVRDLDLLDSVTFCGPQPREALRQYYSAADAFVTVPWYEPFGMTPLEAMSCGTPVVGASVGGIKFTVQDSETGYLVPPRDPDALAVRLACLLRNPELAATLGRRGFERAHAEFGWSTIARRVADLYIDVLARSQSAFRSRSIEANAVQESIEGAIDALRTTRDELTSTIVAIADELARTFKQGGKVLVCGNGGSAADSQHFAAELVGRFKMPGRRALPVIALTADSAVLTAWSNDASYGEAFSRQVEAFGEPGDLCVGISTSGRSSNVIAALTSARRRGLRTIALTGGDGGELVAAADASLVIPSDNTQHIQEAHGVIIHVLCELLEHHLEGDAHVPAERPSLVEVAR